MPFFQKEDKKCEIPIGFNVKTSFWLPAILNFHSTNDSPIKYRNIYLSFLQSNNAIHFVVSDKKMLEIWTNQNAKLALAAMLNFGFAPISQIWWRTTCLTFLPSLVQICSVVSEKKMKIRKVNRRRRRRRRQRRRTQSDDNSSPGPLGQVS